MKEYQKINTIFKRDMSENKGHHKNKLIIGDWSEPEFKYLKDNIWEWTEKIDGTNIRINYDNHKITLGGRTDNAQIPPHLLTKLQHLFPVKLLSSVFDKENKETPEITLYGEGYGVKIQKGNNYIENDVNFILFDVKIDNWWLQRPALEEIAAKLNIPIVPIIGYGTLQEACDLVQQGFKSTIAQNKNYDAEGLVLKTKCGLLGRNGQRIITKIKTVDFKL